MTREDLIKILDEHKALNNSSDFMFTVEPRDLRSIIARLRHMKEKGVIFDYECIGEEDPCQLCVYGYGE